MFTGSGVSFFSWQASRARAGRRRGRGIAERILEAAFHSVNLGRFGCRWVETGEPYPEEGIKWEGALRMLG